MGALVLQFIIAHDIGGAVANVQGWVSASAVRNVRAFAIAAAIGNIDNTVHVGKAVGDSEVVGAAAADDPGIVSNPTAIAEIQGWQGAGDDAGGTDKAVGVVAVAASEVGISGVECAIVTAAVVIVMAGGSVVGVAASAVGIDAKGTGGVAKSCGIVGNASNGGADGANIVARPAFAVAVGTEGVGYIDIAIAISIVFFFFFLKVLYLRVSM